MAIKDQEQFNRITRARIQMLMLFPFYGTLALYLEVEETTEIDTFATDGKKLYYNPEFCKQLSNAEIVAVITHEILHAALGHIWRRGYRDHQKFNMAADYAVNLIIDEHSGSDMRLPENCLLDSKFANKSAEEIYDLLPDQPSMNGGGSGGGNGKGKNNKQKNNSGKGNNKQFDDHSMWDKADQANGEQQKREWTERMISAAEVAEGKQPGSIPGYLKRLIGSIVKPQKNWRELLAEFIQHEINDYGFCPPDRRLYEVTDFFMPSFAEETDMVRDICFVIDTSGSINDHELTVFFSEIVGCIQQFNSLKGHLMFCDTEVAADYEIEDVSDVLKAKACGYGGTRMEAAIEYCIDKMQKGEYDVAGVVVLTDCWDSYNLKEDDVPFPTLWLSTTEKRGPSYGITTDFKV